LNPDEQIAKDHLERRGVHLVFEPDGKSTPPDFLLDGRIAVEVRRLNQNETVSGEPRGLEEVAKPLLDKVKGLLPTLGPAVGESWFVYYEIRRPLPPLQEIAAALRTTLTAFRNDPERKHPGPDSVPGLRRLILLNAGGPHSDFFLPGGYADRDSGGFAISEIIRNLRICVAEKTRKVARVRHKYPEWWLLLVDRIGYGVLDSEEFGRLRQLAQLDHDWDKILLVNPLNARDGREL
jgi:hypothetical protein